MNKLMASIVASILTIFLVGCNEAEVPYQELSAEEKSALTIKPVEGAQLTQTELRYRLLFAFNCVRPQSQIYAEFTKIDQGTRYASNLKHTSQEFAKLCAERPQNAQAKNEWGKTMHKLYLKSLEGFAKHVWKNASSKKRSEIWQITICNNRIPVWMKEIAQLGTNQNPSRAVRINRLYDNAVRDQKKVCKDTSNTQRFLRASDAFWENRMKPLMDAARNARNI